MEMDTSSQTQMDAPVLDLEANQRIVEKLKGFLNKKVNAFNAFETPILEGLSAAVQVETLQCVGAVLDASAKCYAYRVDNTFGMCYKVLSTAAGDGAIAIRPVDQEEQNADGENQFSGDGSDNENAADGGSGGCQENEAGSSKDKDKEDGDGTTTGKKLNKKGMRVELPGRTHELTKKMVKSAEEMHRRFLGQNQTTQAGFIEEAEVCKVLSDFRTDILHGVTQRGVGMQFIIEKPGSLDRKDNQFAIEDAIYAKVSKDFEEGSARSFVSNEVLMNKHGNFMVLHNHWPGREQLRPLPTFCKNLPNDSPQKELFGQLKSTIERAQSNQPGEFALLIQIADDSEQIEAPTIDFHREEEEEKEEVELEEEEMAQEEEVQETLLVEACNGGIEDDAELMAVQQNGIAEENGQKYGETDKFRELGEVLEIEGEEEMMEDQTVAEPILNGGGLNGEAFGHEMAQQENNLAGNDDLENAEINAMELIDENLLPNQNEEENIVPLVQCEDHSHWQGGNKKIRDVQPAQTPMKKVRPRKNHVASTTKSTTKRHARGAEHFNQFDGAAVVDDMCWIPQKVISGALKKAIADSQVPLRGGGASTVKKKLVFDAQSLSPRKLTKERSKQTADSIIFEPCNLLWSRFFFKGSFGFWACSGEKKMRFIRHPNVQVPFGHPMGANEQQIKFVKAFFELCEKRLAEPNLTTDHGGDGDGGFYAYDGEENIADIPSTSASGINHMRKQQRNHLSDQPSDDLDTGFGFLQNVTFSDVAQIYQGTFDVSKVKQAMLRVFSLQNTLGLEHALSGEMVDGENAEEAADEEDSESISTTVDEDEEMEDGEAEPDENSQSDATQIRDKIGSRELFAQFPKFLKGTTKRNISMISAFAVLLHLCNDKQLILEQPKMTFGNDKLGRKKEMTEFVVKLSK